MSTINDRIQSIIDNLFGGNKSMFAKRLGVAPPVIDGIVGKRQSAPSFKLLQKISSIDGVSLNWLVNGINDDSNVQSIIGNNNTVAGGSNISQTLPKKTTDSTDDGMITLYKQLIDEKNAQLHEAYEQLKKKDEQIASLINLISNNK